VGGEINKTKEEKEERAERQKRNPPLRKRPQALQRTTTGGRGAWTRCKENAQPGAYHKFYERNGGAVEISKKVSGSEKSHKEKRRRKTMRRPES